MYQILYILKHMKLVDAIKFELGTEKIKFLLKSNLVLQVQNQKIKSLKKIIINFKFTVMVSKFIY